MKTYGEINAKVEEQESPKVDSNDVYSISQIEKRMNEEDVNNQ